MSDNKIHHLAIYPPIGIARIGNSTEYYLSPEVPGIAPSPEGGFKDATGRVKKQVARFRVYAFDEAGKVLGEVASTPNSTIEWRVHVANVKAAWYEFNNALDLEGASIPSKPRNQNVRDRSQLVIDPGSVTISGKNVGGVVLDKGTFFDKPVKLGEVRTDENGRLLFFGGDGDSASKDDKRAITFANNQGWHDDTCDGVVRAKVTINGTVYQAKPAMVAVTPPNFGPGLYGVVTMNDVVQDLFIREMDYPDSAADGVEFWEHIYPIFERMTNTQWVNHGFFMLFGKNSPSDFTDAKLLKQLADPSDKNKEARQRVFNWFRGPNIPKQEPVQIPPFYGDEFGDYSKTPLVDLSLTKTQYGRLKKWAEGAFTTKGDTPKTPTPFENLSLEEQLDALNQAPLEECLGGPFHPGIELTYSLRIAQMWEQPYRLNVLEEYSLPRLNFGPLLSSNRALAANGPFAANGPGSLTRWMGVPWQTDESSCLSGYNASTYLSLPSFWAARVPNQVLSADAYKRLKDEDLNIAQRLKHFDFRQDWLRDLGTNYTTKINNMIAEWHELGIISKAEDITPDKEGFLPTSIWKEEGRHFSDKDATFQQVLKAEGAKEEPVLLSRGAAIRTRIRRIFRRDER